jgi:hypothetical protein
VKLHAVSCDRFWSKRKHPFGFLLLPGDDGGQEVTVRVSRVTVAVNVYVFLQKRKKS